MYLSLNTVTNGTTNFQRKEFINWVVCVCVKQENHLEQKKYSRCRKTKVFFAPDLSTN